VDHRIAVAVGDEDVAAWPGGDICGVVERRLQLRPVTLPQHELEGSVSVEPEHLMRVAVGDQHAIV